MRHAKGTFPVTGKNIEARTFGSRREAKDWCDDHYPGAPIKEIGCRKAADAKTWTGAMIRLEQCGAAGFAFMWHS
jgi:hypothetical protein